MSQACSGGPVDGATRRNAATLGPADWLCLAASPTFAVMALINGLLGDPMEICQVGSDASPLSGMALMYLLMSAFHTAPWLKLVSSQGSRP